MSNLDETKEMQAMALCKLCGLCCSGRLFIWVKLRPAELDPLETLGMHVFRSDPNQRGFSQPCPLWNGVCTIYNSPHYPRACRAYKCKLLKDLSVENISLTSAKLIVEQALGMIRELEQVLPPSANTNFRERMVAQIEHPHESDWEKASYPDFRLKADALVLFYAEQFGVKDLFD